MTARDSLHHLIAEWQSAETEAESQGCEDALLRAARPVAMRAALAKNLDQADAEDVCQESCAKLLSYLHKGGEIRTTADGWLWRTASNCAVDLHRKRQRRNEGQDHLIAATGQEPTGASAESMLLKLEQQQQLKNLVAEQLQNMPANYRRALEHIAIKQQPRELLQQEYYQQKVAAGQVDENDEAAVLRAQKQARNLVDVHFKRGQIWLRTRLAELAVKEPS